MWKCPVLPAPVVLFLAIISLSFAQAATPKKKESPWDCVRRVLEQLEPRRDDIRDVSSRLFRELSSRSAFVDVGVDSTRGFLIVHVSKAEELFKLDAQFCLTGYQGYAVVPEIGLHRVGEQAPVYPDGDPTNSHLWQESSLVEHLPEAIPLLRNHRSVPYRLTRRQSPERKLGYEVRAQLASDHFRVEDGWNTDRRILIAVQPSEMTWCRLHELSYDGRGVPTEADVISATRMAVAAFKQTYQRDGMRVHNERVIFGGSGHWILASFPSAKTFLKAMADENVSTADVLEHFDDE